MPIDDPQEPALLAAHDQLAAAMREEARRRAAGLGEGGNEAFELLTAFGGLVDVENAIASRKRRES